jgi:adenylate kinase family enzyme
VILGSGGAGKTRLATALAERTGLPVVHLDLLFWRANWQPAPIEEARAALAAAAEKPRWIMDGGFLGLGIDDPRFRRADTVVFLDVPRTRCLWRVVARTGSPRSATSQSARSRSPLRQPMPGLQPTASVS